MKRQAMSELQKAVSDAERKAHEMISAERSKMERALVEAKRQASEDALSVINQQEDSSEVALILPLTPTPTISWAPLGHFLPVDLPAPTSHSVTTHAPYCPQNSSYTRV